MKLMQPIPSTAIPEGEDWVYEVKYDGFRGTLIWKQDDISLISRNGTDLTNQFPEIIAYCKEKQAQIKELLPLQLDGEVAILNTACQSNFSLLQKRGRMKSSDKIEQAAKKRPTHFLCFDLLYIEGKDIRNQPFHQRKQQLLQLIKKMAIPPTISFEHLLNYIEATPDVTKLWNQLIEHLGEGIIAKRTKSKYKEGKVHTDWLKIKNWRTITGVLLAYNQENGYFEIGAYDKENLKAIGKFKHGLEGDNLQTLQAFIAENGTKKGTTYSLPPAICVDVHCLDVKEGELREPIFKDFRLDVKPEQCTLTSITDALCMFPPSIELTKQNKLFWEKAGVTKGDLLQYLRQIAPFMLPFMKEKALTVIRCPDGVDGESFYQKHLPDYAPDYLAGNKSGEEFLLHAGSVEALVWLGNHGAIEYHVPFQKMDSKQPIEIAFDLDPPSVEKFDLAIFAAQLLKKLLDQLQLTSFVKTSGNKGIQVFIPIPEGSMTYEETATFTQSLAFLLEKQYPDLFTTERLKKNRNNRLYIDYVQHGKDKTLIAPYSPRKTDAATVSTPLFWEEVNESLSPKAFTVTTVIDRVKQKGCPFARFHEARDSQSLATIKEFIHSV